MADLSGQRFNDYYLIRRLGQGNFGEVYLAEQVHTDHQPSEGRVALKILAARLDKESFADFLKEARNFKLEHPNIVRIKDFDVENDRPFLVMDYMPNGNLRQRFPRRTRVPWEMVVACARQIANALQYVHERGIVHRDVKPENMLVGTNEEILLTDFGIATTSYTWDSLYEQIPRGTPLYIAPEQITGRAVRESDQYALGIVMYEWLTGFPPFGGTKDEVLLKHQLLSPPSIQENVPSLPPEAASIVMKMLEKEPGKRFSSMRECAASMEHLQGNPFLVTPFIYRGHTQGIRSIAWSPNGKYIASASDKTVQIWNVVTGTLVHTYQGHTDEVWGLAWSPDSKYVASASADKTVQAWEATTGYLQAIHIEHSAIVRAVSWSPNGTCIASGGDDNIVSVWDAMTGSIKRTYRRHSGGVFTVAWSPDSHRIASAGGDGNIHVWNITPDSSVLFCSGHTERITSVSWSRDGIFLVSGSDDCTACIWRVATGQKDHEYVCHNNVVASVAWSPRKTHIVSGSWDATIHLWGIEAAEPTFVYRGHQSWVNSLAWSPSGQYIASGSWDGTVHIISATSS